MFSCLDVANVLLRDGKRSGKRILYHCTCGNHASGKEDKHRSLSIEPGKDWFYDGPNGGGTAWELLSLLTGIHASNKEEMITKAVSLGLIVESNNGNSITDIYDYEDRNGTLVYQVLRKTGKTFLQRRPDGVGGWIWKMDGVKRLPYRLPEISKPEIKDIFWVEGEKDADALAEIGLQATTSSGGAANLHHLPDATGQIPRHLNVTIIPDNDTPGREYANKVAAFLRGKVSSVKILELQNLPEKGDVSDWLAGKDPVEAAEQLCFMADNAPQAKQNTKEPLLAGIILDANKFIQRVIPPRESIIEGVLFEKSSMLIYSWRGLGKTQLGLSLSAEAAVGGKWLYWSAPKPRRVLYIDGELPIEYLQWSASNWLDGRDGSNLKILSSDDFYQLAGRPLNLNSDSDRQLLFEYLKWFEAKPELIVLDNISTLFWGVEAGNEDQDELLKLILELRHMGFANVLIDHAGKDRNARGARGASRKEDTVDFVIKLDEPTQESAFGSAKFQFEITKCRAQLPKPKRFDCEMVPNPQSPSRWIWETREAIKDSDRRLLELIFNRKPHYQVELARELDVSEVAISKQLKKLRELGWLSGLELTVKGLAMIGQNVAGSAGENDGLF